MESFSWRADKLCQWPELHHAERSSVHILRGEIGGREVDVMRDTGREGVVMHNGLIEASQLTGVGGDVQDTADPATCVSERRRRVSCRECPWNRFLWFRRPFKRVANHIIGPINLPSEARHRFIPILVDCATRYAEAVSLRTSDTEMVTEAHGFIYSHLGVP
ncbi:Zinc finger protein [Plakobranchus ocellatus]|uniref:Zinc finger protein n=1 Tax=Plakobranchus ocellatus TaxID=259542 RepID=A0AAV3YZ46_9GAST|nr:Zinc finger protein [Plakobranchus ocellatus]